MRNPNAKQPPDHPPPCALSATLVALLTEADRDIRRLEPENPYRLYEFLHATARRFALVDAFYVCLYSERDQALFFAYNADGDVYDVPLTLPLGDGPTSRVIKQRRPIVWNSAAEASVLYRIQFGQTDQVSQSAIHVPIRADEARLGQDAQILGVLSAQTYQPDAYSPESVQALQWLADCAGLALARERDEAAWRYRLRAANAQAADRQRPLLTLANEFVEILQVVSRQAEEARLLLPPEADPALTTALDALCRECWAAQTKANQLPLRHDFSPPPLPPSGIAHLTPSERLILQHLASGLTNKAIAHALSISVSTVKFHCDNIFRKLEVTSRTAAAQFWHNSTLDRRS